MGKGHGWRRGEGGEWKHRRILERREKEVTEEPKETAYLEENKKDLGRG